MGFACRCVVWGWVSGVLMGFACRCVVWGRVRGVLIGFACMHVCLLDSESKGFHPCQVFFLVYACQIHPSVRLTYLLTYIL